MSDDYRYPPPYARQPVPLAHPRWYPPAPQGYVQYPAPPMPVPVQEYMMDIYGDTYGDFAGLDAELDELEGDIFGAPRGPRRRAVARRSRARRARRRGARNVALTDDEMLMGFMGITQDDVDFIDSFGDARVIVYGQEATTPTKIEKARTFFSEKLPAIIQKFKSKAEVAKIRAAQLEKRAEAAAQRAESLSARASAQGDLAARMARVEAQQARRVTKTRQLSTGQIVALTTGAVALGGLGVYLYTQRS